MANNDVALDWSKRVRGLTIAEHAVLEVMAGFHDKTTGTCRVTMQTLVWRFEASRIYIREVIHKLAKRGFIEIEPRYHKSGLQDVNNFTLKTEQHFPLDDGFQKGMRLLRSVIHSGVNDQTFRDGCSEAWVEALPKRHKKTDKPKLWIALASKAHTKTFRAHEHLLERALLKHSGQEYQIKELKLYKDSTTA